MQDLHLIEITIKLIAYPRVLGWIAGTCEGFAFDKNKYQIDSLPNVLGLIAGTCAGCCI